MRATEDAGGAEVAFRMEMKLPGLGEPVAMTGGVVSDGSSI